MASFLIKSFLQIQKTSCLNRLPLPTLTTIFSNYAISSSSTLSSLQTQKPREIDSKSSVYWNSSDNVVRLVNNLIERQEEGRLFAVVQLCGKQFKVTNNDIIVVEGYWPPNIGDEIRLEKVLLVGSSNFSLVGRPILPLNQISVKAIVIEKALAHTRVKFQYIKRKQYRRTHFIKVPQTHLRIKTIDFMGKVDELGDVDGIEGRIF